VPFLATCSVRCPADIELFHGRLAFIALFTVRMSQLNMFYARSRSTSRPMRDFKVFFILKMLFCCAVTELDRSMIYLFASVLLIVCLYIFLHML